MSTCTVFSNYKRKEREKKEEEKEKGKKRNFKKTTLGYRLFHYFSYLKYLKVTFFGLRVFVRNLDNQTTIVNLSYFPFVNVLEAYILTCSIIISET